MSTKTIYKPKNRKDLTELSDNVLKMKSASDSQLNLSIQIDLQKDLIDILEEQCFWDYLMRLFCFKLWKKQSILDKIEISKLTHDLTVKEKQNNIYHRNELYYAQGFDEIDVEINTRFEYYIDLLNEYYEDVVSCDDNEEVPAEDIKLLWKQYKDNPPIEKYEIISFYLSLESLLYRFEESIK